MRSRLRSLQWADTAFPSGRYTLSHGLEGLMQAGIITKDSSFGDVVDFCQDLLVWSFMPVDLAAHFRVWEVLDKQKMDQAAENQAVAQICYIDHLVHISRPGQSTRTGSMRVGKQLLFMAEQLGISSPVLDDYGAAVSGQSCPSAHGHQYISAALIHQAQGLDAVEAAEVESYGFVAAVASAAVRLQLVDFIESQQLIQRCESTISEAIAKAQQLSLDDIGTLTPLLDATSAQHEYASARLFIN